MNLTKLYTEFWRNDNLRNIARSDSLIQDEWDMAAYFRALREEFTCSTVLDFGCGYGRLFPIFQDHPECYTGIDSNSAAIAEARKRFPLYQGRFLDAAFIHETYPQAEMLLVFTVFLHIDDMLLRMLLLQLAPACQKTCVIVETLGHEWRADMSKQSPLPRFNRTLPEYQTLMAEMGFTFYREDRFPNSHYANNNTYKKRNTETSVLIFQKG